MKNFRGKVTLVLGCNPDWFFRQDSKTSIAVAGNKEYPENGILGYSASGFCEGHFHTGFYATRDEFYRYVVKKTAEPTDSFSIADIIQANSSP